MTEINPMDEPSSIGQVVGNDESIRRIEAYANDIANGKQRMPLMLFGRAGVGKTLAAHLIAKKMGWNLVEMNASDHRDKESIDKGVLSAAMSKDLFGKRNLIVFDEVDEIAARFDKGASSAISNVIANAKNPIIFIANDMWDQSISFLRGKVDPVEFKKIPPLVIAKRLREIADGTSPRVSNESIDLIAGRANGDLRSAINDLYVIIGSKEEVTDSIGMRDRKIDVFSILDKIFLTGDATALTAPLRAIANTDLTNDMLINWIDENIPKRYIYGNDLQNAFGSLSDASIYSARARRSQNYVYWRYMNVMMSSGVTLAKSHYPDTKNRYGFPKIIKELSLSKGSRNSDAELARKLQKGIHSNVRDIINGEMKIFSQVAKSSLHEGTTKEELYDYFMAKFELEPKEVDRLIA